MATWVIHTISATSYWGIVCLMIVENVCPPIPSEVIMPLAGFMAVQGRLAFLGVLLAGTLGSVLGAVPLYYLGRRIGDERLKNFADRHGRWLTVSRDDLDHAQQWFDRHGGMAVLLCRLVPGVRSLISIPAGLEGMPLAPFLLCTTMGAGLWTALLASAGYGLGANFRQVEAYLDPASYVVLAVLVGLYGWRVVTHTGQRPTTAHSHSRQRNAHEPLWPHRQ
jgi:membrane protein DedA with SNARE-associated domain